MTTTLIKIHKNASKMSRFTGFESFAFKMVSILAILLLNTTGISAQIPGSSCNEQAVSRPVFHHESQAKKASVPVKPSVNAAPAAGVILTGRTFPVLECLTIVLHAKEDTEIFDYNVIFGTDKRKETADVLAVTVKKTSKKIQKKTIAPKLN